MGRRGGRRRRSVFGGGDTGPTCDYWLPRGEVEEEGKGDKLVYFRIQKRYVPTDGLGYGFEWWVDKGDKPTASEEEEAAAASVAVVDGIRWTYGKLSMALDKMPPDVPLNATSVALGSQIYVLGGLQKTTGPSCSHRNLADVSHRNLASVFSSDVARPEVGWVTNHLNIPRVLPRPLVLDGELWVFGGGKLDKSTPIAEVFDPALGRWKFLVQLVDIGSLHRYLSPILDQVFPLRHRHVLLYSHKYLLDYDLETGALAPFDLDFIRFSPEAWHVSAIFDNILYCYRDGKGVFGYDLVKKQWYPSPVSGLTREAVLPTGDCGDTSLLHLGGGRLCINWNCTGSLTGGSNPGKKMMIRSIVFTVSKDTSGEEPLLLASIDSAKYYYMDAHQLVDCVALSQR